MKWFSLRLLSCCTLFALSSLACTQYKPGHGDLQALGSEQISLSIPYAKGDTYGYFTDAVIEQVERTMRYRYVSSAGGKLTLSLELEAPTQERIGYQHDRESNGTVLDEVVANETRIQVSALFTLKETASGKVLLGPTSLSSSMDYDFGSYEIDSSVLHVTMGQLDSENNSADAAQVALSEKVAAKVVEYLDNAW
jgi:hypothetical protein